MSATISNLNLYSFYPEESFEISECLVNEKSVMIHLKSKKHNCECPRCHQISNYYHGTYKRFVQDLPILGKSTSVILMAHEYECQNKACPAKTIVDQFDHFLGYYGRFTERCEDFIATLALETSCEGASRICKYLGIQISGDTIIRMLKKRFLHMKLDPTSSCIGIDDFSTKKGNTYCTIICNADSHKPIAMLEGRDGSALKEWLQKNRHVRTITRDRASAYAKVINEELPDARQIADRFHLHQNLLEIIKKCISSNLPQTIRIESTGDDKATGSIFDQDIQGPEISEATSKKNLSSVDNLNENEKKRYELLTNIQKMIAAKYKYKDIAMALGVSTRTINRYKDCPPLEQCHLEKPSRKKKFVHTKMTS